VERKAKAEGGGFAYLTPASYSHSVALPAQNKFSGPRSSDVHVIPSRTTSSPEHPVGLPSPLPVHRDEARFVGPAGSASNGNHRSPTFSSTPPPPAYPAPSVDLAQPSSGRLGGLGVSLQGATGALGGMDGLGVAAGGGAGVGVWSGELGWSVSAYFCYLSAAS
jgi:hypothetical protein